jgi:hypothetical protein
MNAGQNLLLILAREMNAYTALLFYKNETVNLHIELL